MTRILLGLALSVISVSATASELDQAPVGQAPAAVLVRVDAQGGSTVFRTEKLAAGASDQALIASIDASATEANLIDGIKNVSSASELDQDSSTAAWYWWGWGNYYTYGTYSYYYTYSYSYSYYYSGCYWRWYW